MISAAALLAGASDPEDQPLTVASASGGVHGTATLNADDSVTFQRQSSFGGAATFSYSVSDGHGGTAYATAQVGYQAFAASDEPAGAIRSIATGTFLDAVLTPYGKNLIVDRADGSITEYSLTTGAQTASREILGVQAMSVTPDGKYLVAVGSATASSINLQTGAVASVANRDFHQPTFDITATQATNGGYYVNLPTISYYDDVVTEGAETIVLRVTAAGQLFANGTNTTLVTVTLADHGPTGTAGDDVIAGTAHNDVLTGLDGNVRFIGSAGSDRIDGAAGHNVLAYDALSHQVGLSAIAGTVTVAKAGGTDTIANVQDIAFHDGHFIVDTASLGAAVIRLYDPVLGRAPDLGGLDHWLHIVEQGAPLSALANEFANAAEFRQATGTLGNAAFVDYVYQHALGRAPDADGRSFWTGQLDAGLSRADLLVGFSESTEHQAQTAPLVGQGYFDTDMNYQGVALIYDAALGRLPDAAGWCSGAIR